MVKSFSTDNTAYDSDGIGIKALESMERARHYNNWVASKFVGYLGSENIELGAGIGTISDILLKNHPIRLFEISDPNRSILHQRFAHEPNCREIGKDLLECKRWEAIDCVYSSNVLEHIENDLQIIEHSLQLLRPGGYFVALLPAGKWLMSDFDRVLGHYRRYGKSDRRRIETFLTDLQPTSEIVVYKYLNPIGALGWYVKMVLMKNTKANKTAMILDRLIPFLSLFDRVPFPFGQSCLLVIRRDHEGIR